jgi:kinesin family member 15
MAEEHVRVVCRVRPRNQKETRSAQSSGDSFVEVHEKSIRIGTKDDTKCFNFDYSAGDAVTQEELFQAVGLPITKRCIEGYNGTILCYGQTGSGKTFTMFGDSIPERNTNVKLISRGMVPRVLEYLWSTATLHCSFHFKCSFYEIYQEKIYDLLDPNNSNPLSVREDGTLGVYVEGCTERVVSSVDDAYQVLSLGYRSRHVGETAMNRVSSRSHAIFQLTLDKTQRLCQGGVDVNHVITSRFSLVDLAGSERQRDTQATGARLREASVINKSLTCLGKVITELISQPTGKGKRKRHINYRDSKLTFLLRDSLGGNSKVIVRGISLPQSDHRIDCSDRDHLPG